MIWQAEAVATERATTTTSTRWPSAGEYVRPPSSSDELGNGTTLGQASEAAAAPRRRIPGRRLSDLLRDELLMVVSHDLMTPLMTLDGYVRLLREDAEGGDVEPKALAKGLDAMERQVARLAEIAELVREYLRWEERTQELIREPTDLGALVARLVETLQPATRRHRIALAMPPAPIVGLWDPRRLAQVIQNVLGNAVKYSPDGGTITVEVREAAGAALVRVQDQGMGLPPSALPYLFDRGYRVAPDGRDWPGGEAGAAGGAIEAVVVAAQGGARRPDGSGLGLYLCQRIMEAHGGRIWAESAGSGQGSTFWVSLPYCGAEDVPPAGGAEFGPGPA